LPVVVAEAAFGLAHTFLAGDGELTLLDWILVAGTFIVFPMWAGARVARAGGSRRWSALGGVCVLAGTVISAALTEALWPATSAVAWEKMYALALLMVAPLLALLGFLGGVLANARTTHVA